MADVVQPLTSSDARCVAVGVVRFEAVRPVKQSSRRARISPISRPEPASCAYAMIGSGAQWRPPGFSDEELETGRADAPSWWILERRR